MHKCGNHQKSRSIGFQVFPVSFSQKFEQSFQILPNPGNMTHEPLSTTVPNPPIIPSAPQFPVSTRGEGNSKRHPKLCFLNNVSRSLREFAASKNDSRHVCPPNRFHSTLLTSESPPVPSDGPLGHPDDTPAAKCQPLASSGCRPTRPLPRWARPPPWPSVNQLDNGPPPQHWPERFVFPTSCMHYCTTYAHVLCTCVSIHMHTYAYICLHAHGSSGFVGTPGSQK